MKSDDRTMIFFWPEGCESRSYFRPFGHCHLFFSVLCNGISTDENVLHEMTLNRNKLPYYYSIKVRLDGNHEYLLILFLDSFPSFERTLTTIRLKM